eukprot:g896.t1
MQPRGRNRHMDIRPEDEEDSDGDTTLEELQKFMAETAAAPPAAEDKEREDDKIEEEEAAIPLFEHLPV